MRITGPIEIVGAGLIGTSVALACRRAGLEVLLTDPNPDHLRTATGLGAGRPRTADDVPQVVVVAVPPDHLGEAIRGALDTADPGTVVTDVGSVKSAPLAAVTDHPAVSRYVGGHPMAGSERSGPLAASATLFDGRPWAVVPGPKATPESAQLVESLVELCGAVVVRLGPGEHDKAVARTSHVPHLISSLIAGTLVGATPDHLALSGQGVRDVTRIAAGDPQLYSQIISGNSEAVAAVLAQLRERLDLALEAVGADDRAGLESLLMHGLTGTRAIPGKHGGAPQPTDTLWVSVPDHPGELARLFADAGRAGVNIEDVRIDHDPGRPVGLVELDVAQGAATTLLDALESMGWTVHR